MAKCDICDKSVNYGNKLSITRSHISKRTSRTFKPNRWTTKKNQCLYKMFTFRKSYKGLITKNRASFNLLLFCICNLKLHYSKEFSSENFYLSFTPKISLTKPLKNLGTFFTTIVIFLTHSF